jgi:glycosyltransferase involved in cell wall biosynthesis
MKVSIITIAYNSQETIADTIRSVAGQDYPYIEYIIVDGNSSDNTIEIVKSFGAVVTKLISEKDQGIYDAMNKGVKMATGDIIGILNSDDFYTDRSVISDIVKRIEESGAEGLYGDLVYVNRDQPDKVVRSWKAGEYRHGKFLSGWMPPHPTFFVKRLCYEKFGLYTLELRSAADYELMLRFIHKHQIKMTYLSRVITKMRLGGQSNVTLMNRIKANLEDRKAWKMNGIHPGAFTLTRKPLSKVIQFLKK